jgi:hypothetical protein
MPSTDGPICGLGEAAAGYRSEDAAARVQATCRRRARSRPEASALSPLRSLPTGLRSSSSATSGRRQGQGRDCRWSAVRGHAPSMGCRRAERAVSPALPGRCSTARTGSPRRDRRPTATPPQPASGRRRTVVELSSGDGSEIVHRLVQPQTQPEVDRGKLQRRERAREEPFAHRFGVGLEVDGDRLRRHRGRRDEGCRRGGGLRGHRGSLRSTGSQTVTLAPCRRLAGVVHPAA